MNEQAARQLAKRVTETVGYVDATLRPAVRGNEEWEEIHRGRAQSSIRQLEHLEELAEEILNDQTQNN